MNIVLNTADIIVESLIDWNVSVIFGLPGYGINGLESLRRYQQKIRFILVRHEEAAAFMACAYAKYKKEIGVCVTKQNGLSVGELGCALGELSC
ncbi:MAG: thiamine pyrophosphate-binding protein [Nitrososphaeraceae archaeon]